MRTFTFTDGINETLTLPFVDQSFHFRLHVVVEPSEADETNLKFNDACWKHVISYSHLLCHRQVVRNVYGSGCSVVACVYGFENVYHGDQNQSLSWSCDTLQATTLQWRDDAKLRLGKLCLLLPYLSCKHRRVVSAALDFLSKPAPGSWASFQ